MHGAGLSKGATITLVVVGGVVIVLAIVVAVIASHGPNLPSSHGRRLESRRTAQRWTLNFRIVRKLS